MVRHDARRTVLAGVALLSVLLTAGPEAALAAEARPGERPGGLTPNQLVGGQSLNAQEALAACGPAAAVAFAQASGRAVSLDTAVAAARHVGWTPARGMTGPYGELALLERLKIPATLEEGVNAAKVTREVQAGRPVIIRTSGRGAAPGHYFVAERLDRATGRFDLAQSALVLRASGGRSWFSLAEISSLGFGVPTHAFFLASPTSQVLAASPPPKLAAASAKPATSVAARPAPLTGATHVVDTGGSGARLRAAPGAAATLVGSVADGTRVTATGPTAVVAGRVWRHVAMAGGGTAWVDGGLLRPS